MTARQAVCDHQGPVAMRPFLTGLATARQYDFSRISVNRVQLHVSVDDLALSAEQAVTVASIAHEAIGNAYAHGFPGGIAGFIALSLNGVADGWVLKVRDNGIGMATNGLPGSSGLELMRKSALRLNAALSISTLERETGTVVRLWLPLQAIHPAAGRRFTKPSSPIGGGAHWQNASCVGYPPAHGMNRLA